MVGRSRKTTIRAKVVLPEPDSPTSPITSPFSTDRSTSLSARTTFWRPIRPME